jgi:hypothetical protein
MVALLSISRSLVTLGGTPEKLTNRYRRTASAPFSSP